MKKIKKFQYGGQQYTADYLSKNTILDSTGWQYAQLDQGLNQNPGLFGSNMKPMKSLGTNSIKLNSGLKGPSTSTLKTGAVNTKKPSSNFNAWGAVGQGADLVSSFIPETNTDETVKGLNSGYDAASSAVMAIPGWGTIIGGGMKVVGALGKGIDAASGGKTTIMNPQSFGDKFLSSSWGKFLNPAMAIGNSLSKKTVKGTDKDLEKKISNQGYNVESVAGAEFGGLNQLISRKQRKRASDYKKRAKNASETNIKIADVVNSSNTENLAGINSFQDIVSKNQQNLMGGINTRMLAAQNGMKFKKIVDKVKRKKDPFDLFIKTLPETLEDTELLKESWELNDKPRNFDESTFIFKKGGAINVIPDGAFHSRKHNIELEGITKKGIPVVSYEEGGKSEQHAEVEINEVIFHLKLTKDLEALFEKFNKTGDKKEKDSLMIEAGKMLTTELLENTDDKTNLIESIK